MAWLISVLGAALALGGAISLGNGIAYIRLDWGQTQTVAGTVALTGGIVTVALGAVLFALRDLARRSAQVRLVPEASPGRDGVPAPAMSRLRSKLATVGMPKADPVPEAPLPVRDLDEAVSETHPSVAPRLRASFPVEPETTGVAEERPVIQAPSPPLPTMADAPTVVGRYEANGASYVLFSDGTIEVETESGVHRFASMADLKGHIERQDTV